MAAACLTLLVIGVVPAQCVVTPTPTPTVTPTRTPTPTPTPTPTVPARTVYHVAATGNDSTGNASAARPWRTIQKAADSVPGGASVHVAAGTYNERVTVPAACSGSAADPTEFIADGAVVVSQGFVVNADYTDFSRLRDHARGEHRHG